MLSIRKRRERLYANLERLNDFAGDRNNILSIQDIEAFKHLEKNENTQIKKTDNMVLICLVYVLLHMKRNTLIVANHVNTYKIKKEIRKMIGYNSDIDNWINGCRIVVASTHTLHQNVNQFSSIDWNRIIYFGNVTPPPELIYSSKTQTQIKINLS